MDSVKRGVEFVIKNDVLSFLSWDDVELRACGPKNIEIADLQRISSYNVGKDHKIIKWFWEMFESFTQEERQKYLKFVWGRAKMPSDTTNLDYQHQVNVYSHMADTALPQAHTCFFTVDFPEYKTLEMMTKQAK
jgi:E3 ubiquitin-protein ligase HERC1